MIGKKRILKTVSDIKIACHNENIINISFSINTLKLFEKS